MSSLRWTLAAAVALLPHIAAHSRALAAKEKAVAIATSADLYTTGGDGSVYHVDPHSGRSAHVGTIDVPMIALTYDSDHRILYGLGPAVYDLFLWSHLYQIDTATWHATALVPRFVVGDGNVQGVDIALGLAYDRASGWIYVIQSPTSHSGNLLAVSTFRANPTTGEVAGVGSWRPDDDGFPFYYAALDPVDGTLWGLRYDPAWENWSLDKQTGLPTYRSVTPPAGLPAFGNLPNMGPAAFHPHSHTLYRYAYGDGNAWLYQIDLTTGQATKASAAFSAPGHSMFFVPKQLVRR
jgi:hypothetical protein